MINNKKEILIAMDTMLCGGIEKSAISLLSSLDSNLVKVTLLLDQKTGLFLDFIPDWIKVIESPYGPLVRKEKQIGRKLLLRSLIISGNWATALKIFKIHRKEKKLNKDNLRIERARRFFQGIQPFEIFANKYDLAIAYSNLEQHILIAEHIQAHKKIAFFHTQLNPQRENLVHYQSILDCYDKLLCVSHDLEHSLINLFPDYSKKIQYYPHIINQKQMIEWAGKYKAIWPGQGIKILSVGRLAYQKGFDMIPKLASQLSKKGIDIQWVILGEGSKEEEIKDEIKKYNVSTKVFIVKSNPNPYPYFSSCDIYVQPSRYEGYCLTLAEARAFAKPIVSTKFDGSNEQLEEGKYGMIVDCKAESLFKAITSLIESPALCSQFCQLLSQQKISNFDGVKTIMEMLN